MRRPLQLIVVKPPTTSIRPGLCSITLRAERADRVAGAAADAGLETVEWGSDVHVSDARTAEEVARLTDRYGLAVASYGTYYRLGENMDSFADLLSAAVALGAPRMRVWAGSVEWPDADDAVIAAVVDDARRIGDLAGAAGIRVGFEFHGGTLTSTAESTVALLEAVGHPQVGTYWQPTVGMPDDDALAELDAVFPWLEAVHVFSWWPRTERLPLTARADLWRRALARVSADGVRRDALLEFVPGDDPAVLEREAAALRDLAGASPSPGS